MSQNSHIIDDSGLHPPRSLGAYRTEPIVLVHNLPIDLIECISIECNHVDRLMSHYAVRRGCKPLSIGEYNERTQSKEVT